MSTGYEPTHLDSNIRTVVFSGKESDWPEWKFRFTALLAQQGLLSLIKTSDGSPDESKNAALYYKIASSIIGEAINVVRRAKEGDGMQAWKELMRRYEAKSAIRKEQLLLRLFSRDLGIKADEHINAYIDRVLELRRQLDDVGEQLSDEVILGVIKHGLPWGEYGAVLTSLQLQNLNFEDQLDHLKSYAEAIRTRQRSNPATKISIREAHITDLTPEQALRTQDRRRCYTCNEQGHIQRNCPSRSSRSFDNRKDIKTKTGTEKLCQYCGFRGHLQEDCRLKYSAQKRLQNEERVAIADEHAFTAASVASDSKARFRYSWTVDSGATSHMSPHRSDFDDYVDTETTVTVADGNQIPASGIGSVRFVAESVNVRFQNVLHVPELHGRLFSVSKAVDCGHSVHFTPIRSFIRCKTGAEIPLNRLQNSFIIDELTESANSASDDFAIWHRRLCHVSIDSTARLLAEFSVTTSKPSTKTMCEACALSKSTRLPYSGTIPTATAIGETVFTDVCGPIDPVSLGGKRYVCVFIDSASGMRFVYPIRNKSDALTVFQRCITEFESCGYKINRLHSDRGGEYTSTQFNVFCQTHGIKQTFTAPYSPEQNGVAERSWRTLFEKVRCILVQGRLNRSLWAAAIDTVCYVLNRLPATGAKTSPFEQFYRKAPKINNLRVFGCPAFVHDETSSGKLGPRSVKGQFIGYDKNSESFLVLLPTGTVRISHNVKFDELFATADSTAKTDILEGDNWNFIMEEPDSVETQNLMATGDHLEVDKDPDHEELPETLETTHSVPLSSDTDTPYHDIDSPPTAVTKPKLDWRRDPSHPDAFKTHPQPDIGLMRSERLRKPSERVRLQEQAKVSTDSPNEPRSFAEASRTLEASKWREACETELETLSDTWDLVERPENRKIIGNRWVFKRKRDAEGNIVRYRSRLVAKGYSQIPGVDYQDTFAPVARMSTLRTLLILSNHYNWSLENSDISNAYLNAPLKEAVFMDQPEGFDDGTSRVLKLRYSLYGLVQAGHNWNETLNEWLLSIGFLRSEADTCLYSLRRNGLKLLLVVVVDDLIYGGDDDMITWFKDTIDQRFKATHDGEAKWILGLKLRRNRTDRTLTVTQEVYAIDILNRFEMNDCKPSNTPLPLGTELTRAPEFDRSKGINLPYKELVGSLMYLAIGTRPDLAYSVSLLCRYMDGYSDQHWNAAKHVLRYLRNTISMGLTFRGSENPPVLTGFSDSDYAGCVDSRKSTTGYVFFLGGAPVSWTSSLQPIVATSSTYAEYIALCSSAQECMYLREVMTDMGIEVSSPTVVHEDNQGSIFLAKNPAFHKRSKHIEVRFHYVRECVSRNRLEIQYCPTEDMVADIFTKQLPVPAFCKHRKVILGMSSDNE